MIKIFYSLVALLIVTIPLNGPMANELKSGIITVLGAQTKTLEVRNNLNGRNITVYGRYARDNISDRMLIIYQVCCEEKIDGDKSMNIVMWVLEDEIADFLNDKIKSPPVPFLPTFLGDPWNDTTRAVITYRSGHHLNRPDIKWRIVSQKNLEEKEMRTYLLEYGSKNYDYKVWFAGEKLNGSIEAIGYLEAKNFCSKLISAEY